VAIHAGDEVVWHAPHSGAVVSLEPIWTSSVFYGRDG
jgi:peptidoglycan DL-endopeptidase CwlO